MVAGGLTYSGESGGLNEATSDIFGTMVEFYANNPADPGDYQIGEKININGNGTPLRYMYNPTLDGSLAQLLVHHAPRTSTCTTPPAWPTTSSSTSPRAPAPPRTAPAPSAARPPAVAGIGRAKAEKIWFRALDVYFTSNTTYVNTTTPANTARAYTLSAATDLYGLCSAEYKAVQAAWTAVNVAGSDAACPATTSPSRRRRPSGSVNPGSSVTTTVTDRANQRLRRRRSRSPRRGLPAGATASFNPTSVTTGGSSTLTIATTTSTPFGTYAVTHRHGPGSTRTATFTLTVNGPPGCSGPTERRGDPDNTTVTSRDHDQRLRRQRVGDQHRRRCTSCTPTWATWS